MNVDIISEELRELGLFVMAEKLGIASEKSLLKNYTNLEFLHSLLESEIEAKKERSYKMRLKLSSLPYLKTLAEFDFVFGKGVDKELIDELSGLAFVMNGSNICFLGPPGVGKTHLSIALSYIALEAGNSIYFTTLSKMATDLRNFPTKKRLSKYLSPKVLVIDEIGYRPVDESASSLFFDIVSERYEKGSIIASSNKPFSQWGNIFNDSVLATAILDRLLHHATVVNIRGDSYRLKDRKKQGVFTHVEVAENKEKGDVR